MIFDFLVILGPLLTYSDDFYPLISNFWRSFLTPPPPPNLPKLDVIDAHSLIDYYSKYWRKENQSI